MKLSNMKLGVRLGLGFGSILVIFCVAVFLTTVFLGMVDRNSHTVIDESFPHALLAAEMAFDVVQVQQWLTDVSVSHDEAGYQDAEEAANGFRDGVTIFQQLYTTKNDTESLKQLEALEIAFEHYYDEGKIMAEIYVSQGREAGNSAMKDFDDVAETLTHKIEQFKNEQIEDASTMMETIVSAVDNVRNVLLALSGLAVVVGFLIASLISRSITRPITKVVEAATAIAEGDLSKDIDIYQKDEIGSLAHVFRNMNGKIHDVLEEMNILIQTVQNGRLDNRGSTDAFAGSWRDLVIGMNNLIDAFVMPVNITATYLDRIAKGDVPDKITEEVNGDFNKIKNNLNLLIDNIGNVLQETNGLNQAVQDGKLDTRGNAKTFVGDWKELVESMNTVIDAFVAPLNMTAGSLDRIAKGDIPDTITEEYKGDFNQVKNNLNTLIDAMNEITQLAKGMADGNLTAEVKERSAQDVLMQALNTMIQHLNETVADVKTASDNVASGSQTISLSAAQMSQGATEQATAAEEASSSMEEMAANIRQNADNALRTEKIAMKASEDALAGGKAVAQTVVAMHAIVKKISVVEEISRQTHMLSLNATIEAAKAKEYGKGFGVVASEVRALAERSQTAAVEINGIASESVEIAAKAWEKLQKLVPDIQKTAELIQEISAASREQNSGIGQINLAIQQLDHVIQQNAASSEEIAATSEELTGQAGMLQRTIAFFKVDAGAPGRVQTAAESNAAMADIKALRDVETEKGNDDGRTSDEYVTYMDQSKSDKLDAEFERF